MKEMIESQIREVLKIDVSATVLSQILFSPNGLFSQMAPTEAERRIVSESELFRRAQDRLWEIGMKEASPLRAEVDRVNAALARARNTVAQGAVAAPQSENGSAGVNQNSVSTGETSEAHAAVRTR